MIKKSLATIATACIVCTTSPGDSFLPNNTLIAQVTQGMHSDLLDHIALRFYYIQRLDRSVKIIQWLNKNKLITPNFFDERIEKCSSNICIDQECTLTHKKIISCIERLQEQGTLVPMIELWNDITHFQMITDDIIIKEFSYLIFHFLKKIIHQNNFTRHAPQAEQLANIMKLNQPLESLNIEQVLGILDILIEQLPEFVELYELNSKLTWKQWFKKYWLTAPITASIILLKIYFIINNQPQDSIQLEEFQKNSFTSAKGAQ